MGTERFGRLTKRLHATANRRRMLTGFAAMPLALGVRGQVEAKDKAKVKDKEKGCKKGETLCVAADGSEVCADLLSDPFNCGQCGGVCQLTKEGQICEGGVCAG